MPKPVPQTRRTGRPTANRGRPATSRYAHGRKREAARRSGWVTWVVISFLVIPLIGFGFKLIGKSQDDREVLQAAHSVIASLPNYSAHAAYFDKLIDRCHSSAFEKSYRLGGRHRTSALNEKEYVTTLFADMKRIAEQEGEAEVAGTMAVLLSNVKG